MRTSTPWWLAWLQLLGLLVFFVGQRLLDAWPTLETTTFVIGLALVLGVLAVRALAFTRTAGSRRQVERTHLYASLGASLALVCYAMSTEWGLAKLGVENTYRWRHVFWVLTGLAAAASILPMVMIEGVLGVARRDRLDLATRSDDDGVEYRRVREVGLAGLTVALAAGLLMVTCNVAKQRNLRKNVGYFRTSEPGESTVKILTATQTPVKVLLLFPKDKPEVKDEVRTYFEELADASDLLMIEEHDPVVAYALAKKHMPAEGEGLAVLVAGEGDAEKTEKIKFDLDIEKARKSAKGGARTPLRVLDGAVNSALRKLVREKRNVYLTVGHGELNDPKSVPERYRGQLPDARAAELKARLKELHYQVKDLDIEGVDAGIPEDAKIVMSLGPRVPFRPEEIAAFDAFLARGGSLLLALDPEGKAGLESLEARLGVRFNPAIVIDDKDYPVAIGPYRGSPAYPSTKVHMHPAVATAAQGTKIAVLITGSLDEVEVTGEKPKLTHVIKTKESSFRDTEPDGRFTDGVEQRGSFNVATVIEGPKTNSDIGESAEGFRAIVLADANLFMDLDVPVSPTQSQRVLVGGALVDDVINWLGGEEGTAGAISNENDKVIETTHKKQAWWFLLTVVLVPMVVLVGGLVATRKRRRPSASGRAPAPPPVAPAPVKASAAATAVEPGAEDTKDEDEADDEPEDEEKAR